MTLDHEAELIGLMEDWKAGKVGIGTVISFIILFIKQENTNEQRNLGSNHS